ncbi:3'-5' exoribonuclease [bacterium]|nr:3'-5' exoribonuclease [bacterium]
MRDKAYFYILQQQRPCSSQEIFNHLFDSKPALSILPVEKITDTILKNDNRFEKTESGLWRITKTQDGNQTLVNLYEKTYVVFDLETTGSAPPDEKITEIGAVKIVQGKITETFQSLLNPQKRISSNIERIIGITNKMVQNQPTLDEILPKFLEWIGEDSVLVAHNADFDLMFLNFEVENLTGKILANKSICTLRMAKKLLKDAPQKGLLAVSQRFGIELKTHHRAFEDAKATAEILLKFFEMLPGKDFNALLDFQAPNINKINFDKLHYERKMLNYFPEAPGVYFMRDKNDKIIYIGKAKNLKQRIRHYFYNSPGQAEKIKHLLQNIYQIDYQIVGSELEALLLESELIKKEQPVYNYQIKNYTSFPFLKIDLDNNFPRIFITKNISADKGIYFGPFTNTKTLEKILETIQKSFFLRQCEENLEPNEKFEPCFFHHLKQCEAPCNFSVSKERYLETVFDLVNFLKQKNDLPLQKLVKIRNRAAEELDFEFAQKIQNRINDLEFLRKFNYLLSNELQDNNFLIILPSAELGKLKVFIVLGGKLEKIFDFAPGKSKITLVLNYLKKEFYEKTGRERTAFEKQELDKVRILAHWVRSREEKSVTIDLNKTTSEKLSETIKEKFLKLVVVVV